MAIGWKILSTIIPYGRAQEISEEMNVSLDHEETRNNQRVSALTTRSEYGISESDENPNQITARTLWTKRKR